MTGMMAIKGKIIVKDLFSKKEWESLDVPDDIIKNLVKLPLLYTRPSLIQAKAIPEIMNNREQNFIFQAMNGSGKTGAFAIPAIMVVDKSVNEIQVLILASTRELIR